MEWSALAEPLAVNTPSAAYNKAKRLRASALADPGCGDRPVRRTPEAVLAAERQAAVRAAAERRAQNEAARRYALLAPIAQRLIEHRTGLDGGDEVTFWLDQIAAVLPNCRTPTQFVSLETYVLAVVRELTSRIVAAGDAFPHAGDGRSPAVSTPPVLTDPPGRYDAVTPPDAADVPCTAADYAVITLRLVVVEQARDRQLDASASTVSFAVESAALFARRSRRPGAGSRATDHPRHKVGDGDYGVITSLVGMFAAWALSVCRSTGFTCDGQIQPA